MQVNHAILHVFDFVSCVNDYAQEEIPLSDKRAKGFVTKHVTKALGNLDNMRGEFAPDSSFATEIRRYFAGETGFVDLSTQLAEFIAGQLGHMEKSESCDLLVVDFEDTPDRSIAGSMDEEEAIAAFAARTKRYFAFLLLDIKPAYVHDTGRGDTGMANTVAYNRAILPAPSQKLSSYAIIDAATMEVRFCDKKRSIAGQDTWLIPDCVLQCSMEASPKAAFSAVTELVEAVAEEYGENSAVALSKAKAYVDEVPWDDDDSNEIDLAELGRAAFEDNAGAAERFHEALESRELPDALPMERRTAERVAKSHKIVTDTGITITFPAGYSKNPEYMTFTSESDGTISISIRNIWHIENR